jgi:pyruvate kinase
VGLFWGVYGLLIERVTSTDETIEEIKKLIVEEQYLPAGSPVVITIGRPLVAHSRTNMLSIETV